MKTAKRVLALLALLLVLLAAAGLLLDIMRPKSQDGVTPMLAYYDQPRGTVDVLIIGSSHAGLNLSAQALWDECGIASFTLWGAVQPLWNSYYDLIEALKTQTPKVVVLETLAATLGAEYSEDSWQELNLEGMRPSLNKWRAIQVSAPPERWLDLLTVFPLVHTRYRELNGEDFTYFPWNDHSQNKGTALLPYSIELLDAAPDTSTIHEAAPLPQKQELYLRKIIDLCREKDLPLVLLNTPTAGRADQQPYFNRVAQIAKENGLPYLDCNLLDAETGFDYTRDFGADGAYHLNVRGVNKISRYLARYLQQNYGVPDRRGEPGYEGWEFNARTTQNEYIRQLPDSWSYFQELAHSRYTCYLVKGYGESGTKKGYTDLLDGVKRIDDAEGSLAALMEEGWGFDIAIRCSGAEGGKGDILTDEEEAAIGFTFEEETGDLLFNGTRLFRRSDSALQMAVFDPYTTSCVDVLTFDEGHGYLLERPGGGEDDPAA